MELESQINNDNDESKAVHWLKDAGLEYLISQDSTENEEPSMVMFGSLTRRQSLAVQVC